MIKFNLACKNTHDFEAWFSSGSDFDDQQSRGLVSCPHCGSVDVQKALMVPSVSTGRAKEAKQQMMMSAAQQEAMKTIREMVKQVKDNTENVGDKFSEEARKIHYGETEARGIHGSASLDEVHELVEEGVEIMPLPDVPEDQN